MAGLWEERSCRDQRADREGPAAAAELDRDAGLAGAGAADRGHHAGVLVGQVVGERPALDVGVHSGLRAGDRPVEASIADAIERGRAYLAAGADLVFVPGKLDADVTRRLVDGLGERKLSVIGVPGALTAAEYEALGVARISYGPTTQRVALTALQDVAADLYRDGVIPASTRTLN